MPGGKESSQKGTPHSELLPISTQWHKVLNLLVESSKSDGLIQLGEGTGEKKNPNPVGKAGNQPEFR